MQGARATDASPSFLGIPPEDAGVSFGLGKPTSRPRWNGALPPIPELRNIIDGRCLADLSHKRCNFVTVTEIVA